MKNYLKIIIPALVVLNVVLVGWLFSKKDVNESKRSLILKKIDIDTEDGEAGSKREDSADLLVSDVEIEPEIEVNGDNENCKGAEWCKTFGDDETNYINSLQETSDGGFIFTGRTNSDQDKGDIWLVKLDFKGNKNWEKVFSNNYFSEAYSVQQTLDKGYIIAGMTSSSDVADGWLIKTDFNGNKEWDKIFGNSSVYEEFNIVRQTIDGGYIISGFTYGGKNNTQDVWVVKTDSKGEREWEKFFHNIKNDEAVSVLQTMQGKYIVVANTSGSGNDLSNVWLIGLEKNGDKEWEKFYGGSSSEHVESISYTNDGGYIIVGSTDANIKSNKTDYWILKIDSGGNKEWEKTYNSSRSEDDVGYSIQQTNDGGYIVAGVMNFLIDSDFWVIKIDSRGNKEWEEIFGGPAMDFLNSAIQVSDGNYVLAGSKGSLADSETGTWAGYGWVGDTDGWLIKINK